MERGAMENDSNKPTIGIITALSHECLAVQTLLLHPTETFMEEGRGPYQYYLGELPSAQGHNHRVVMSLLPNMGNDSAAARATLLLTHFPSVRWIIMVGIAGGVPDPEHANEHVRLGDVVVSNQSGIIQYDFVKETLDGGKDGRIVQSPRHPSRPPSSTLTHAVKRMQVREMQGKFPWEPFIREASLSFSPVVTRPPASSDILAKSTNPAEVETHPLDVQRCDGLPRIFLGPIASSNTLLKNPLRRDALRDAFKVKAVEMEGSGVADATWDQELAGYLVIRVTWSSGVSATTAMSTRGMTGNAMQPSSRPLTCALCWSRSRPLASKALPQRDMEPDLRYVRRRYLTRDNVRAAIARVINALFAIRNPQVWGEGTTTCASDSKKFGAWDQNLRTEYSQRHHGAGIMVYWHIEKKSACIYSQIKTVSSSEVAAMLEGVLRHCTDMTVEKNFVDSHGQSEIAFAVTRLLGFQLMPRLKGIHAQKLYRPFAGQKDAYPHLQPILSRPINWDLIRTQYDEMVKVATALRLGTAETEAILRRFTRASVQHPTYAALAELGKVVKTIFLCSYLRDPAVRREVHEGLQVVENWNSANNFIHYGKGGEIATNRLDDQEVSVLCMALVQNALCLINTLMIQRVLAEPAWMGRMTPEDLRGLTPLIYAHVNPYGVFRLDMDERLALEDREAAG